MSSLNPPRGTHPERLSRARRYYFNVNWRVARRHERQCADERMAVDALFAIRAVIEAWRNREAPDGMARPMTAVEVLAEVAEAVRDARPGRASK
jgi:hypothetical protein